MSRKIIGNSFGLIAVRGTPVAIRLCVLLLLARSVGVFDFGVATMLIAIAEIGRVVADFGIDTWVTREFARQPSVRTQQVLFRRVFSAKILLGLTTGAIASFIAIVVSPWDYFFPALLSGALIPCALLTNLVIAYYQAHLRAIDLAGRVLLGGAFALTFAAYLLWLSPTVWVAVCSLLGWEVVLLFLLLYTLRPEVVVTSFGHISSGHLLSLIRTTWPIALTAFLVTLYSRIDILALGAMLGTAAVGLYGFAYRLTEPFLFIGASLATSIYAQLAAETASGRVPRTRMVAGLMAALISYGVLSLIAILVVSNALIAKFFVEFAQADTLVTLLAVALVVRIANVGCTAVIQAYGRFLWVTKVAAMNVITISALLFVLVPRFGVEGAAAALLIGESVNLVVQSVLVFGVLPKLAMHIPSKSARCD